MKRPLDPRHRLRIKTFLFATFVAAVVLSAGRFLHTLDFSLAQICLALVATALVVLPVLVKHHPAFQPMAGYIAVPLAIVAAALLPLGLVGGLLPIGQRPSFIVPSCGGCWLTLASLWILLVVWSGFRHRGEP